MLLSEKVQDFILHMYSQNGEVRKETQYLIGIQYYTMCWYLRDKKIIEVKKVNKKKQKVWKLTKKGNELAELIKKIRVITDGK
jgi:predicted transcriptional regulator